MIYNYIVKVKFFKGDQPIIKDYKVDFLHLGSLFCHLEQFHHNNYTIIYVKEYKRHRFN